MTNLNCGVKSCCYNSDSCCCRTDIEVCGTEAHRSDNTCCGSFKEDRGSNSNHSDDPKRAVEILCEAENCIHNSMSRCLANHIDIAGHDASKAVETLCSSFTNR